MKGRRRWCCCNNGCWGGCCGLMGWGEWCIGGLGAGWRRGGVGCLLRSGRRKVHNEAFVGLGCLGDLLLCRWVLFLLFGNLLFGLFGKLLFLLFGKLLFYLVHRRNLFHTLFGFLQRLLFCSLGIFFLFWILVLGFRTHNESCRFFVHLFLLLLFPLIVLFFLFLRLLDHSLDFVLVLLQQSFATTNRSSGGGFPCLFRTSFPHTASLSCVMSLSCVILLLIIIGGYGSGGCCRQRRRRRRKRFGGNRTTLDSNAFAAHPQSRLLPSHTHYRPQKKKKKNDMSPQRCHCRRVCIWLWIPKSCVCLAHCAPTSELV